MAASGRQRGVTRAGAAVAVLLLAGVGVGVWSLWAALRPGPVAAEPVVVEGAGGIAPPHVFEVVTRAAAEHEREGRSAAAEAVLNEAVSQYPEDQGLRLTLARFLLGQNRTDEAYLEYESALAIGPRDASIEFEAGSVASMLGDHERAVEHFAAVQVREPGNPQAALRLGAAQMARGELDAAQASLVRATVLDPGLALAWGSLAELSLRRNEAGLALQHARRAREAQADEPAWRLLEARALKRGGEPEQALLVLGGLRESHRVHPEYARVAAECYGLLGRAADAADLYERVVAARGDDVGVAFEAALWHERAGNRARALELARRAAQRGHAGAAGVVERLSAGG